MLFIVTAAAFVPDFISSCGIASLFPLAAQFETSTDEINNLTSNWSIFMLGWGGLLWVLFVKKFGRLPCLFWSMFIGLGFTIGCTVAPNLHTFAAMRILAATFQTAPQVSGLYAICDMFPFHLQARKLNLWTLGFVVSPFIGPSFLGFIVGQGITWRWVYGVGCIYSGLVLILVVLFAEETMYDRHLKSVPPRPTQGLRYRVETLLGITGAKMAKYRPTWTRCVMDLFEVVYKPVVLLSLL
jgi:MFS family permease